MGSTDGEVANPSVVEEEAKKIGGEQDERCKNGIQAIFAGFVAVSTAREIDPTIASFWEIEPQRTMILPTLKSLVLPINHDPNIEDTKLIQQVLSSILLDSSNTLTRRKTKPILDEPTSLQISAHWTLTHKGHQNLAYLPLDSRTHTPSSTSVGSPAWWDG